MRIFDISHEIFKGMTVYKNKEEKQPQLDVMRSFTEGKIHESRISMDLHTGTHLDSPLHVLEDGESVEKMDLLKIITLCRVLDYTGKMHSISAADLKEKNAGTGEFLLLKTQNSFSNGFDPDFVYLDVEGARYLAEQKIKGVGIDSLGIERGQPDYLTHKTLLGAGIVILEGLKLTDIAEGEYILIALPLKIKGAEASPTRAILLEGELFFR